MTQDCPITLSIVDSLSGMLKDGDVVSPLSDEDFALPDLMVFHKGVVVDSVFVVLKKTAKLDNAYCRVVLQIESNEYFTAGETDYCQAKIYFTSAISIPTWWDETIVNYYLGVFSPEKYLVFCQEIGVTDLTGVEEKYIREYALQFKRYLEANPQYEADGSRMEVSVIG